MARLRATTGEGDDYAAHSRRNLDATSRKAIAPGKPRIRDAMIYRVSGSGDEAQILLERAAWLCSLDHVA